jgi:hypothetical protein
MKTKTLILTLIILQSFAIRSYADGIGIGLSAIYNPQTESFGADFRINFKPSKRLRIVPQVAYYPAFNKITEYYLGASVELRLIPIKTYHIYGLIHGAFNGWINYSEVLMKDAQYNNWNFEAGAGIVRSKGCWRPFLEYRYNVKWYETNLRLGILYVFGCNKKGFPSGGNRKRSAMSCPAYD